jgi:hypothetical protein
LYSSSGTTDIVKKEGQRSAKANAEVPEVGMQEFQKRRFQIEDFRFRNECMPPKVRSP